jgi:hypothetical protein
MRRRQDRRAVQQELDIARGGVVLAGVRPLLDGGRGILWVVRRYIITDEN